MPEYLIKPKPTKLNTGVMMYQCSYCNRRFRTQNRHVCHLDPATRGCATCGRVKEFSKGFSINSYCTKFARDIAKFIENDRELKDRHGIYYNGTRTKVVMCPYWRKR